tara:strand:+ start:439 stop:2829 length:2391 start_codon:yes stop_codon:yes gene_type:complete
MVDDGPNEETRKIHELINSRRPTVEDAKSSQGRAQKRSKKRSISKPIEKKDEEREFFNKIRELDSKEKIQEIKERLTDNFENLELWLEYAKELREAERYAEALSAFNTVLIKDSKNRLALRGTGLTYQGLEKWENSIEFFERVLESDPDDRIALIETGYSKMQLLEFEEALKFYQRALDNDERDVNALENLGYCNYKLKRYSKAIEYFSKVIGMEDVKKEFARKWIISCYYFGQMYEKCLEVCDEMIKNKTEDDYVWFVKGWILNEQKKFEEAIPFLTRGIQLGNENFDSLAYSYRRLGKYTLAKLYYQMDGEVNPERENSTLQNLAHVCYLEKNFEEAERYAERAITSDPINNIFSVEIKMKCFTKRKWYNEVLNLIEAYEEENGRTDNVAILRDVYRACFKLKKFSKMSEFIERALDSDEKNSPMDLRWKAVCLSRMQKTDEGLEILDKILEKNPDDWIASRLKGDFYEIDKKNLELALKNYEICSTALENDVEKKDHTLDDELENFVDKGRILKKMGNQKEKGSDEHEKLMLDAIRILEMAIEKDENYLDAWKEIANCYWNLKNYVKCEEISLQILEKEPGNSKIWEDVGDCILYGDSKSVTAIPFYEKALKIDGSRYLSLDGLARCQFNKGDYEKALINVDKIFRIGKELYNTYFLKGRILSQLEKYDEAVEWILAYIKKFPDEIKDNAISYSNISLTQIWNKKYDDAIKYAEKSLELDATNSIAWARIGEANKGMENYEKAIQVMNEHFDDFNTDYKIISCECIIHCYNKLGNKEKKEEYEKRLKELEEEE